MIEIITDYGYCFGVKNAIDKLLSLKNIKGKIYLTHPLLHNIKENEELMKRIGASFYEENIVLDKEDAIILSAHGHSLSEERKFIGRCLVIDATCPLILSRYEKIPKYKDDVTFLYIGKEKHQETIGFLSHFPYFTLIDTQKDLLSQLKEISFKRESVLIPQTTISGRNLDFVLSYAKEKSKVSFSLPICPLYNKRSVQGTSYVKELDPKKNAFLVCGDTASSNAKEIYLQMKEANPSMKGDICLSIDDLNLKDYEGKNVFVASATSVSKERVEQLKKDLQIALRE